MPGILETRCRAFCFASLQLTCIPHDGGNLPQSAPTFSSLSSIWSSKQQSHGSVLLASPLPILLEGLSIGTSVDASPRCETIPIYDFENAGEDDTALFCRRRPRIRPASGARAER